MTTIADYDRTLRHVWSEPKSVAKQEHAWEFPILGGSYEPIDFDWYEPRFDQPWRRQVARDRAEFGGEHVGGASAPVEGPNNPNRLTRELWDAERDLERAEEELEEKRDEASAARARIAQLQAHLASLPSKP